MDLSCLFSADEPLNVLHNCARPKAKAEALRRAGSAKIKSAAARTTEDSVLQLHRPSEDGKGGLPKKKKKEKAMYEHVGRMNVRPFQEDEGQDPGQVGVRFLLGFWLHVLVFGCRCLAFVVLLTSTCFFHPFTSSTTRILAVGREALWSQTPTRREIYYTRYMASSASRLGHAMLNAPCMKGGIYSKTTTDNLRRRNMKKKRQEVPAVSSPCTQTILDSPPDASQSTVNVELCVQDI